MSQEHLEKPPENIDAKHLYANGLESMFYLFLTITLGYATRHTGDHDVLKAWRSCHWNEIADAKEEFSISLASP
jgi:hypothetical protein